MAYEKDYDDIMLDIYKGSRAEDFRTPKAFLEFLHEEFLFVPYLDACASDFNYLAPTYYTKEDSCLAAEWEGPVFINPPYGRAIVPFLEKCNEQILTNPDTKRIMALLPARIDTKWFHDIVCKGATRVYLIKGRFNFSHKTAVKGANAPFCSMLVEYNQSGRYHDMPQILTLDVPKEYRGWTK